VGNQQKLEENQEKRPDTNMSGLPVYRSNSVEIVDYTPPAPANLRCWKHSLQKTGRPCVGRNGTVVSLPHAEQLVVVSTRSRIIGPAAALLARLALHALQRFGSFLNCLSAKKSCSPAVQMKSAPQSTHLRDLSWKSIGRHLYSSSTAVRPDRKRSLQLAPELFPVPLPRKGLLGPSLVPWFQIERMLLDVLDDVFLLNLALEAAEGAFNRLAFLDLDFSHASKHPLTIGSGSTLVIRGCVM
jgi:hypothetical protein